MDFVRSTTFGEDSMCRRCKTDIPAGLRGKHFQVLSTRNVRSWSASSSSFDGEDHVLACRAQWTQEERVARVAIQSQEDGE